MNILTKSAIFGAKADLPTVDVPCPEWGEGGVVRLRMLTATERDAYEAGVVPSQGQLNRANIRARLVSLCAIDADGNRLFTDNEAAELGKRSSVVVDRLFDAARLLSKLRGEDVVAEKNDSPAVPNGDSSTGSASSLDSPIPII